MKYALHLAAFVAWLFTVLIRFHIHVEPGQFLWFAWVTAQGLCAAMLGYTLGRNKK